MSNTEQCPCGMRCYHGIIELLLIYFGDIFNTTTIQRCKLISNNQEYYHNILYRYDNWLLKRIDCAKI